MSENLAVCLLIQNNGLPLGITRRLDPRAWGLIGGKVDRGEDLHRAIIREAKEEADINLIKSDLTLVDFTGRARTHKVHVFTASPKHVPTTLTSSKEGFVAWTTWAELFRGPFGEFNIQLFRHLYVKR